jgi:glutathione S-transferase
LSADLLPGPNQELHRHLRRQPWAVGRAVSILDIRRA